MNDEEQKEQEVQEEQKLPESFPRLDTLYGYAAYWELAGKP